jgi:c(7)-type cytochrome triheme protein
VLAGSVGHAACFGACHGAPPPRADRRGVVAGRVDATEPARVRVCTTCHPDGVLTSGRDRRAFAATRATGDADFTLAFGHARHARVACARCHDQPGQARPRRADHQRCAATCHDGSPGAGPAMARCASCHVAGRDVAPPGDPSGVPPRPSHDRGDRSGGESTGSNAPRGVDAAPRVRAAFSHADHAARDGGRCERCHTGVAATDARPPRPTAASCASAGCHDARGAFPITAACTRCHQTAPASKYEVARPTAAFSHTGHLAFVALLSCATCHPTTRVGDVGVSDHAPCTPCHGDDFGRRTPTICGACHASTEPWRALVADRFPAPRSEFGASLDHARHPAPCAGCHRLATAAAELRPPRGHAACTGSTCHAVTGGPAPQLWACGGCHALGLADRRAAARTAAAWSVRTRFEHATHARGSDDRAIECTRCHVDMRGADLQAVATPPKSTCVPCHDGVTAFKITGTGCARCHAAGPPR